MQLILISAIVFLVGYIINVFYITVFYHRGLTHGALKFSPRIEKFIAATGPWITGIDPKGWILMHRLHHLHSDTELDPHSPVNLGIFGVAKGQLHSYEQALRRLMRKEPAYTEIVKDLNFDVNIINQSKLWMLPYATHLIIAVALGFISHSVLIGSAYYLGMMSHPIQGWMVNALAHHYGYRNFETTDNSKNNAFVAWFVVGEGYQNNHHTYPHRANFAVKPFEIDLGYMLCKIAAKFNVLKIVN